MRRIRLLLVAAIVLAACANISVTSPDGKSSATYYGTSIVGSEEINCGSLNGVTSCGVSGQNVAGLAQAIAPYVAQAYGIPLPPVQTPAPPAASPTATPTPARLETPIH